jgi:predicted P-loop ATPase
VLAYDEFAMQTTMTAAPPWERTTPMFISRAWTEHDDLLATNWLQQEGIGVPVSVAQQAVEAVARDDYFHPVVRYLEGLEHDGLSRLAGWVSKYLGAEPSTYHAEVGKVMLIAAVARIYKPGCKVDTVPILEGKQGAKKSTAMRTLFAPWFSDELAELGSKDAAMQTRGIWGIEISELDAMSRGDASKIKAFISRTTDRFRPPYGKRLIESPRSCTLWGTTNSGSYLKDETGGRRFLPVRVGRIDVDLLQTDRDQLWAEAVVAYKADTPWWLTDDRVQANAEREQRDRYAGDPWDSVIARFVEARGMVTVEEILTQVLHIETGRQTQVDQNRIARCLRSMGWERKQRRVDGDRKWIYVRAVTESPLQSELDYSVTGFTTGDA